MPNTTGNDHQVLSGRRMSKAVFFTAVVY